MTYQPTITQRIYMQMFEAELTKLGIKENSPRWKRAMTICWAVETLRTGDGDYEADTILEMTLLLLKP